MAKTPQHEEAEDWSYEVQTLLLSYLIADADCFARCREIIKPNYFDSELQKGVRFIIDYTDRHHTLPTPEQIKALGHLSIQRFPETSIQHAEWCMAQVERFCRYKAFELALLAGVDLLEKGKFGQVETMVKEAMTISLASDLGTNYFGTNAKERLERMRDKSGYVSTGWKTFDHKLYGGFTRGALNIFAGGRGAGKSLVLQNLGLNWAEAGEHVIYFSLELSEDLISLRLDQMNTGVSARNVFQSITEVALQLHSKAKKLPGSLTIKRLPEAGTTVATLRAYLREYEIKTGIRPTAILVDYLDLMYPLDERVDPSNLNIKDKYTSEELRALAHERNLLCGTASQLGRGAVEAEEYNHAHIAGGISKISTADNLIGLHQTKQMRETGIYQFQFLKTRSSDAVGQKLDMKYDGNSLRISDLSPEEAALVRQPAPLIGQALRAQMGALPQRRPPAALAAPNPDGLSAGEKLKQTIERTRARAGT